MDFEENIKPITRVNLRGLTLIELLVTMAITSMLLVGLAALVSQSTAGYSLSQRSLNHLSQSRAFIQIFQSELSLRLSDTPLIHYPSNQGGPMNSDKILFVRTIPEAERRLDSQGDIAASYYYVAFAESANQRVTPKLFRKIVTSHETQSFIEAGNSAEFPEVDPTIDEPILDFVLNFQAIPMYVDPTTGNEERWDKAIHSAPSHIKLAIRTMDESFSSRYDNEPEWNRLTISPKDSEWQMIRTVSCNLTIGK
jgi:prepilin-type N-terminal cleavage/methylation domain-containing protein